MKARLERMIQWLKSHLLIVSCVIASLAIVAFVIYRQDTLSTLDTQIADGQDHIEKIHRNTRYSATLGEDLKRLDDYQGRLAKALFDPSAKAANLSYFYSIGSRFSINVTRVEQNPVGGKDSELKEFDALRFELSVEGDFANIIKFIDAVRGEHLAMRVEKLTIRPSSALDKTGHAESADISITVLTDKTKEAK